MLENKVFLKQTGAEVQVFDLLWTVRMHIVIWQGRICELKVVPSAEINGTNPRETRIF